MLSQSGNLVSTAAYLGSTAAAGQPGRGGTATQSRAPAGACPICVSRCNAVAFDVPVTRALQQAVWKEAVSQVKAVQGKAGRSAGAGIRSVHHEGRDPRVKTWP